MVISEDLNTSTSTCTSIMSKNITITKEAYDYLKSIKGEKSFSETILSLKNKSNDFLAYAGCLKDFDAKSVEKSRDDLNDDWKNRLRY